MKAMTTFLLRLPESMMAQVTEVASDCHTTKSAFIRQSLHRNISLTRDVEMPLLRRHHQENTLKQLRVVESITQSNDGKESS